MNFDELQNAWQKEDGSQKDMTFEGSLLKKSNQPIDAIRKKMKHEFWFQLAAIIFIGFLPLLFAIRGSMMLLFYTNYIIMLFITTYYFLRFGKLFKTMHNYNTTLKDGLTHLYFEIRLHLEMYKSFNFILIPFVFFMTGITMYKRDLTQNITSMPASYSEGLIKYAALAIIVTLLVLILTNQWINSYYGKHVKKIKGLLDDLSEQGY
jgi:hypothetical protein